MSTYAIEKYQFSKASAEAGPSKYQVIELERFTGTRREARAIVRKHRDQLKGDKKFGAVHERWVCCEKMEAS